MVIKHRPDNSIQSEIILQDYFPLTINFGEQSDDVLHKGLYYKDAALLELELLRSNMTLSCMKIVFSNNFRFIDNVMGTLPDADNSVLQFNIPGRTDCKNFDVLVYTNGIEINVSGYTASRYYRSGNVYFGFNEEIGITNVIVSEMNANEIAHSKFELINS